MIRYLCANRVSRLFLNSCKLLMGKHYVPSHSQISKEVKYHFLRKGNLFLEVNVYIYMSVKILLNILFEIVICNYYTTIFNLHEWICILKVLQLQYYHREFLSSSLPTLNKYTGYLIYMHLHDNIRHIGIHREFNLISASVDTPRAFVLSWS